MEYRNFRNSGLLVSAISYGNGMKDYSDYEEAVAIIKACLQNGINHFDTGEIYGPGKGEAMLGKALKEID